MVCTDDRWEVKHLMSIELEFCLTLWILIEKQHLAGKCVSSWIHSLGSYGNKLVYGKKAVLNMQYSEWNRHNVILK